jgi:hypothetical protein
MFSIGFAALPVSLFAQTTFTQSATANTFVSSSQPGVNFSSLGAMQIAAATAVQNNVNESLLLFNTSAMDAAFNADYGAGNWQVTGVSLKLFSNMSSPGTQPGNTDFNLIASGGFELDWLSDNNWSQTSITWNSLPGILPGTGGNMQDSLGDFNYTANGAASETWNLGLDANMVASIDDGTPLTIFGQPTSGSTVGYLFNTTKQGNPAVLNVTVAPVPEPGIPALVVSGVAGMAALCRRKA